MGYHGYMGKQFEAFGFRVEIRTREHGPIPHVHAVKGGADVKLAIFGGQILSVKGKVSLSDQAKLRRAVNERQDDLMKVWRTLHG